MSKILIDTSVWIDALNGKRNWQVEKLEQLIDEDAAIVLCPTILQEILQGIRSDADYSRVKHSLEGFGMLLTDPVDAAYGAASLYRQARKRGVTIRKSNDCLIAFYCMQHKAFLLHNDGDFDKLAACIDLKILAKS